MPHSDSFKEKAQSWTTHARLRGYSGLIAGRPQPYSFTQNLHKIENNPESIKGTKGQKAYTKSIRPTQIYNGLHSLVHSGLIESKEDRKSR